MKNKKAIYIVGSIVLLVLIGSIACAFLLFSTPLKIEKATYLYIDNDDNIDSVYTKLKKDCHASSLTGLRLMTACSNYADNIHAGAYKLKPSEKTWHIFHRLKSGHQSPVRLTVPSVRTIGALAKSVSRRLMTDSASIAKLLTDSAYCAGLGYNQYTIPSLFIPNTYEVYWTIDANEFIKRMKKEHDLFWNKERTEKAKSIGFTPEEVATLASIVEEETANKAEKPMVAGLYINRLHTGMPLQADPTVKFGLQEFGLKRILHKHLEVDSRSVHAFIVGEHGDSEIAAWSSANVSGIPLHDFCEMRGHINHDKNMRAIAEQVKNSAYEIIEKKKATYYGIGMAVKRICEAIVRDEKSILPVSSMIHGIYGIDDVVLSMPAIVGKDGVETLVPISMSSDEVEKLKDSAKTLKEVLEQTK